MAYGAGAGGAATRLRISSSEGVALPPAGSSNQERLEALKQSCTIQLFATDIDCTAIAAARAGLDARRPRLTDWLARIHARPAYARALQVGGPFRIL